VLFLKNRVIAKYTVMTRKYNNGAKCYQTKYLSGEKELSLYKRYPFILIRQHALITIML